MKEARNYAVKLLGCDSKCAKYAKYVNKLTDVFKKLDSLKERIILNLDGTHLKNYVSLLRMGFDFRRLMRWSFLHKY